MRRIVTLLAAIVPLQFALHAFRVENPQGNSSGKPATVKVLLEEGVDGTLLEVKGGYTVLDPLTNKKLSSGYRGKRYFAFPLPEGIKWGEEFPATYQIRILPTKNDTTLLVNGIQYRGALDVFCLEGKLTLVNEVDVESYLKSILAHKISHTMSSALRDAVAIVERTNVYYAALANYDSYWHVRANDVDYAGYTQAFSDPDIDRSVDNTKYLVMTYDEQPFPTTWTENSAGRTAGYSVIFRKNIPTPSGVTSAFAKKDREDCKWSYSISASELAKLMQVNRISGIELYVDQKAEKVYGVRIKDGSHIKDVDFLQFQQKLGKSNIKSTDFTVEMKSGRLYFTGYGEGSGVGLCLYSAMHMAEMGAIAPKILADFYPLTHLEKMRSYPDTVISPSKNYFISPRKKRQRQGESYGTYSHL